MSELLEWLLKKENKPTCRIVSLFFIALPLIFFFSGGFVQGADGEGILFSSGWFREFFLVILSMMFLLGIILGIVGFNRKTN